MATISITEASRRWGISRQTIYKRLSDGHLSADKDRSGNTLIDVSELLRVFGEPAPEAGENPSNDAEPNQHFSLAQEIALERLRSENLAALNEVLREQVISLQAKVERLERREDDRDTREGEREKRLLLALESVTVAREPLTRKLTNWLTTKTGDR